MTEVSLAQGDEAEAESWFHILEECVTEPMTMRNREWLAAVRARRGPSAEHDLRVLDAWRQRYDYQADVLTALTDREAASRLHELDHLLGALEAKRQWPDVHVVAATMLRGAGTGRAWFAARAHAARAVALEASGRPEEADEAMAEALAAGRSGGLTRSYTEGSPLRSRLLGRAADRPETRRDAERVRSATGVDEVAVRPDLTPRQLEVLRAVAAGLSNRAAADALGVAETTVRTHLRAAYGRLGVGSRTAAVAEARRLGLLA
jgi:DNA-binding NarL/FixJ family response regulator